MRARAVHAILAVIGAGSLLATLTTVGPAHAAPSNMNWRYYGNTLSNARFQNVDQINPSNVSSLRPAWVFHTGVLDPKASLETSPIVVDGTMYVTDGHDDVFALNAATGTERWTYRPRIDFSKVQVCCGRNNRGVAFGDGSVFLGRLDDRVVALSAGTGRVLWQRRLADPSVGATISMAPQFVDGKVLVGIAGGEFDIRGEIAAFDAATGRRIWTFHTTKPGTWAGDSWKTGGAPVWETAAVDRARGLVYVNTGNTSPDLNGRLRAGENLYSSSIVALHVQTGQVAWFFQEVHHGIWDYDAASPPLLFSDRANGQQVPALAECGKNGSTYVLNRATGRPILPVTEMRVPSMRPSWQHPWPTQPVSSVQSLVPLHTLTQPSNGLQVAPEYTPPRPTPLVMTPGSDGGCEWPPGAYSPRTHFLYFGQRYEPQIFQAHKGTTTGIGSTFTSDVPGINDFGVFGAIDSRTGRVVWKIRVPQPAKSGVAVAGDLVFFGESNGRFHAVDAATGRMLWTFDGTSLPGGGGANAAPVAYMANGTEFVANAFGGNPDDREIEGSPVGDAIVAFALPGN